MPVCQERAAALEASAQVHDGGVLLGNVQPEHILVQRSQVCCRAPVLLCVRRHAQPHDTLQCDVNPRVLHRYQRCLHVVAGCSDPE